MPGSYVSIKGLLSHNRCRNLFLLSTIFYAHVHSYLHDNTAWEVLWQSEYESAALSFQLIRGPELPASHCWVWSSWTRPRRSSLELIWSMVSRNYVVIYLWQQVGGLKAQVLTGWRSFDILAAYMKASYEGSKASSTYISMPRLYHMEVSQAMACSIQSKHTAMSVPIQKNLASEKLRLHSKDIQRGPHKCIPTFQLSYLPE